MVDPGELLEVAELTQELAARVPALTVAAAIALADGEVEVTVERLEAFEVVTEGVAAEYRAVELVWAVRLSIAVGRVDAAELLVASSDPLVLRDRIRRAAARAMLAEVRGAPDAAEASTEVAALLAGYGDPFEQAMALLGRDRLDPSPASRARAEELLRGLGSVRRTRGDPYGSGPRLAPAPPNWV